MKNSCGRMWSLGLIFLCVIAIAQADIAVLREKGPKSGAAFANIGALTGDAAAESVAMKSADVTIHLKRGEGDALVAECEAKFLLADERDANATALEFLAAFPVTGLRSGVVAVKSFRVETDGERPATVLRRAIEVSRRDWKVEDMPIHGQLDARFRSEYRHEMFSDPRLKLGTSAYLAAYAWPMRIRPQQTTAVKVSYVVELMPQTVSYTKSYEETPGDEDVIPFADLKITNPKSRHYFFDYVLVSGATWHGSIGVETIKLTWDASLGNKRLHIETGSRTPLGGWSDASPERSEASTAWPDQWEDYAIVWKITGKPQRDVLIAIPETALSPKSP